MNITSVPLVTVRGQRVGVNERNGEEKGARGGGRHHQQ